MKVLITGGSGLVGRYVVDELAKSHSVEVLDIKPLHRLDIRRHSVDMLDLPAVVSLVEDFDVIVHLAGIPHPLKDPPEKIFRVNTIGTFNMLEAAAQGGVNKFIFMSSESTLGFAFASRPHYPEYIPIDEQHPLRPQDAYGLSKLTGEGLCAGKTRQTGMQTLCLRAPWIWVPEEKELYRALVKDYRKWYKNLWAFVHVFDVVQAISTLVAKGTDTSSNLPQHDTYFICAEHNWTGKESRELLEEFYPQTKITDSFQGSQSLLTYAKAQKAFGFTPRYETKDILHD